LSHGASRTAAPSSIAGNGPSSAGNGRPPLVVDLQGAQSVTYRERGVARYVLAYGQALLRTAPQLVDQLLVRADLLPTPGLEPLLASGALTTTPRWDRNGGLFHAMSPFDLDTPVALCWPRAASRTGAKLVVTVYDLIPEVFPELYLSDPGVRRRYRARRELVRAADHVVTLSRSAADDVVDRLGVPDDRVTVVGAACAEVFAPAGDASSADRSASIRAAQDAVPGLHERFLVYNGAIEPRKNVDRLIEAFAGLPESVGGDRQLVLVCRLEPLERHHFEVMAARLELGDRLLLAGSVSDVALVALYRAADLVVYPSLYEGYGLPVAEAMACGAPVVGSAASSLPELLEPTATFDPTDVDDMRGAVERALVDESHRQRLRRWSARSRPSWDDVAHRAAEVYRALLVDRRTGTPARPAAWRKRPVAALVTPWPPAATGVARYSAHLAEALSQLVELDVFVEADDGPRADLPPPVGNLCFYPVEALRGVDRVRGGYDAVVGCIGNSHHHVGLLRALRIEGVRASVLAHDVRLTGLYHHGAARGAVPEGYAEVARHMYPWVDDGLLAETWVTQRAEERGILMAREIVTLADRFLVTSEFAAELARLDVPPADAAKVEVVPFGYPAPAVRSDDEEEPGLLCSFGLVNEVKRPRLVLEAFALVHGADPRTRLVFVGPVAESLRKWYGEVADALGVGRHVEFAGEVDDDAYAGWLRRAAVALQLRSGTNGETSAAVADCLAHGIPTVVSEVGAARELPPFVVKVAHGAGAEELASVVAALLADPRRRRAAGHEGVRFAEAHSFDRAAAAVVGAVLGTAAVAARPARG